MITASTNWQNANAPIARKPRHRIEIAGYSKIFTGPNVELANEYAWLKDAAWGSLNVSINDLECSSTLGDFTFTVQDRGGALTADQTAAMLEGSLLVVRSGFAGLALADYIPLFSGIVTQTAVVDAGMAYKITAKDASYFLQYLIYVTGDDGYPTSSNHPKSLYGDAVTLMLDVLQNQLGMSSSQLNLAAFNALASGALAGVKLQFSLTTAPQGLEFLTREFCKPLGVLLFTNGAGLLTPISLIPTAPPTVALAMDKTNVTDVSFDVAQPVDELTYEFDYDGSNYGSQLADINAVVPYPGNQVTIESQGVQSVLGGWQLSRRLARALFLRHAWRTGMPTITAFWRAAVVEPGDFVTVSHPEIPDLVAGTMGVTNRLYQALDVTRDLDNDNVQLKLIDANWLAQLLGTGLAGYKICNGATQTAPYVSSSNPSYAGQYMFICDDTGHYTPSGDAGHALL
jgi:hypothetical protein